MAVRKMTFSIPEAVAKEFLRTVTGRNRSKYVANALAARLKAEENALARACDIANASEDVGAMEQEFDAISADIAEPWTDAAASEVWWVRLDPTLGSEISKTRPCLILSTNVVNERRRTVVVVPLSTSPTPSPPLLIPVQCAGRAAMAVTDQIRAIAKDRLQERLGEISPGDMQAVEAGVLRILELG